MQRVPVGNEDIAVIVTGIFVLQLLQQVPKLQALPVVLGGIVVIVVGHGEDEIGQSVDAMEAFIAGQGVPSGTHPVAVDVGEGIAVHLACWCDAPFLHHPHRNALDPLAPVKGKPECQPGQREVRVTGLMVGEIAVPLREKEDHAAPASFPFGIGKAVRRQQAAVDHGLLLAAEKAVCQVIQRNQLGRINVVLGNLDPVQYQKLRELEQQLLQVNADYAAQEAIFNQQADHTGEKIEEIKKAIRQKKVLLTAAANYAAKRAEMTFENLSSGPVKIRLYEVLKTTGEVKDVFRFTYNGRDYRRLSRSERALAGIYTVEMVKRLTGRNYPVFIDDAESIANLSRPTGQAIVSRVVAQAPLSVRPVFQEVPLKKAG